MPVALGEYSRTLAHVNGVALDVSWGVRLQPHPHCNRARLQVSPTVEQVADPVEELAVAAEVAATRSEEIVIERYETLAGVAGNRHDPKPTR